MKKYLVAFLSLGLAAVMGLSGCYVETRPATVTYSYGGWNPYYYNGYLVYFDSLGRPYYYSGGTIVYVPSTWYYYNRAVNDYRVYGYRYRAWHARYHHPTYYSRPVRVHRGGYYGRPAPRRTYYHRSYQPVRRARYRR